MSGKIETDKLIGSVLEGKYKMEALVARGGMAKVYKALQTNLNRPVAIKVLDPKHVDADDPEFRKRFELEAQMTSQLNHPNTVTIHDYGYNAEHDVFYFVMEYITGKTLRREMKDIGEFGLDRALHIAQQIARSVRQAHTVGVVHRDLKPSNVLITQHDEDRDWVKVVDFGLLKLRKESVEESSKGVLMGSPRYMSPEQIRRVEIDHRSDLYSLGVNLYQMIVGRAPFVADSAMQILMGHLNDQPPPFQTFTNREVPEEVEALVMQLLAKKPEDRPSDAEEVIEALGRLRRRVSRPSVVPAHLSPPAAAAAPPPPPAPVIPTMDDIPSQPSVPQQWSDTVPANEIPRIGSQPAAVAPIPGMGTAPGVEPAPSRTGMWIAITSVLILVIGVGIIAIVLGMDLGGNEKNARPVPGHVIVPMERPPTDATKKASETDTAPAIQTFNVHFVSSPDGADVFEGDAKLCTTPCTTEWVVVDGKGDPRKFMMIKEGFEKLEIVENVPAKDIEITVDLFPVEKAGSHGGKPGGAKVTGDGTKPPIKGKAPEPGGEQPQGGKKKLNLVEEFPE